MRSLTTSVLRIFLASEVSLKTEYIRSCRTRKALCGLPPYEGLYRFDGHTATVFQHDPNDPAHTLPSNLITTMHEDRKGRLWAGTPIGLVQVDKRTGKATMHRPDSTRLLGCSQGHSGRSARNLMAGDGTEVLPVLIQTPSSLACILLPTVNAWVACNKMIPVVYGHSVMMVSTGFTQRRKSLSFFR